MWNFIPLLPSKVRHSAVPLYRWSKSERRPLHEFARSSPCSLSGTVRSGIYGEKVLGPESMNDFAETKI